MQVHRMFNERDYGFISGTYSEISFEHLLKIIDLDKVFNTRKGEVITDLYITDFGMKAKFEFEEVTEP